MLEGIEVRLNTDYFKNKAELDALADQVVFTGAIDRYFDYWIGSLEYRRVRFETEVHDIENYQGVAVVNYTERKVPYTRVIEHKYFMFGTQPKSVISMEYSVEWKLGDEPYYPINDEKNQTLLKRYQQKANELPNIIFGGRLGA